MEEYEVVVSSSERWRAEQFVKERLERVRGAELDKREREMAPPYPLSTVQEVKEEKEEMEKE